MIRTNVFFPEPMLAQLREVSATSDVPVGEIVRVAVNAWLGGARPDACGVQRLSPVRDDNALTRRSVLK